MTRARDTADFGHIEPVSKSGDTMTGYLTLSSDPSSALHAVTKQYVDSKPIPDATKIINSNDVVKATGTGSVIVSADSTQIGVFKTNRTELYAPQLEIGVSGGYFEEGETNPSGSTALGWNGYLYATKVYNAVYNDIADFQDLDDELIYGKCYYRATKYGMKICCERLQKGVVGIASDTYGYGLGARENCVPLAIGGWVLAYVDGEVESGDALTVNENGNLTKMEMWEKVFWPERIVAIYQYKEPEEIWNDIKVNGRHWVKIK